MRGKVISVFAVLINSPSLVNKSAAGEERGSTVVNGKITYFVNSFNLRNYLLSQGKSPDTIPQMVDIVVGEEAEGGGKNFIFGAKYTQDPAVDLSTMIAPSVEIGPSANRIVFEDDDTMIMEDGFASQ